MQVTTYIVNEHGLKEIKEFRVSVFRISVPAAKAQEFNEKMVRFYL